MKKEKGAISIFVLIALLFMSAYLIISFASNINKSKVVIQQKEIIGSIYSKQVEDINEKYNSLTALPNGNINAKVMFINKQPTEYESAYGLSFSDKNGLFISLILDKINVPRESVYFTDMIKCNNQLDEQSFNECINRYLMEEINIVNPSVIVCNSMSVFKTCISRGIFKGLPSDISYGNIYNAELFNGNHIKATAIYDLNTVLQKEGEDYIRCKNDLWSQILNAFKAL